MPHIRLETAVRTHPKFLEAGPAACWLYACGLMYCQDTLTDGHIPSAALEMLGVKGQAVVHKLAAVLVAAGLWEPEPGGWKIHDYLKHNKSAEEIKTLKADKQRAGSEGGKAKARALADTKQSATAHANGSAVADKNFLLYPYVLGDGLGTGVVAVPSSEKHSVETRDVLFERLVAAYPQHRRSRNFLGIQAFSAALDGPEGPEEVFRRMMLNLASQLSGEQWAEPRMVPRLDKWLMDGLWQQVHQPSKPRLTGRNRTTLEAAARILSEPDA